MHFGKIVKGVAQAKGFSAEELAVMLGTSGKEVLSLYEQREWMSGDICAASAALEYDFGKYLNPGYEYNFLVSGEGEYQEFLLTVRYPKGKMFLLKSWLKKITLIARAIGLELQ